GGGAAQVQPGGVRVEREEVGRALEPDIPSAERLLDRGQPPGEHQHEGEGQVGDGVRVAPRGVEHRHALGGGQLEVDVHRVAPAAADHAEPAPVQHLGVHQVRLDDQHVGPDLADVGGELGAVEV